MTRVGFVGCGPFASSMHYPSVFEVEGVEVAAIAERDAERARAAGKRFGIGRLYNDAGEMLRSETLDAVYCIMQPQELRDVLPGVLERAPAVFIEKPPGLGYAELAAWARLAEKRGVLTMVGFNRRYSALLGRAREAALEGGRIKFVAAQFFKNDPHPTYKGIRHAPLLGTIIHAVDVLVWLGGRFRAVHGNAASASGSVLDLYSAAIEFEGGALGSLAADFAACGRIERYEIHAEKRSCAVEPPENMRIFESPDGEPREISAGDVVPGADAPGAFEEYPPERRARRIYGFVEEHRRFIECVRSGAEPETSFARSLETMRLVEAIAGLSG